MLSSLRPHAGPGRDSGSDWFWQILSSKVAKLVATGIAALCAAFVWLSIFRPSYLSTQPDGPVPQLVQEEIQHIQDIQNPNPSGRGRLHLLVPATSSNSQLCKLMLSAQILGYPTPVLINYGDIEAKDGYVQHLAKVGGILHYLENLETSNEYSEDLVLIIDGYDIWFQLRPDVLIKRFYAVNEAANARAVELYGADAIQENDIRQTVIFGPDKICWPVDFSRPACWAVPSSGLPQTIFGPPVEGERNMNDAKWLNSGTVMGAAEDLREIFRATLNDIETHHVTNSDQYYFANLLGDQEFARSLHTPERLQELKSYKYRDYEDHARGNRTEPNVFGKRTEYHIGLDYESTLFQTLAFWKQHLSWSRAIDSWRPPISARYDTDLYDFAIAEDIQQSLSPFEPFKNGPEANNTPGWSEVSLVYNILTKHHPVLLHVTGNPEEKKYRSYWWKRLWFQSQAEKLRLANHDLDQRQISPDIIDGKLWFNAEAGDADEISAGGKDGAWTDRRGWLSWKRLCSKYDDVLYAVPPEGDQYAHPKFKPKEEPKNEEPKHEEHTEEQHQQEAPPQQEPPQQEPPQEPPQQEPPQQEPPRQEFQQQESQPQQPESEPEAGDPWHQEASHQEAPHGDDVHHAEQPPQDDVHQRPAEGAHIELPEGIPWERPNGLPDGLPRNPPAEQPAENSPLGAAR